MGADASLIEVDWASFDPWRIQPVRHALGEHPLLQIDQLVALGKRLERTDQTFSFNSDAGADADFNTVARTHPNRNSTTDTLQRISEAKAWMLLRHVQADPVYCTLVDTVLDAIKPQVDRVDPGMCYRAGWIFVSSPHTVTPFHIDRNHVLLLQLCGTKTVYVWDADDVEVVSDHARAHFLDCHQLDLVQWHEAFRARAHVFELGPGMGVYMPLTSPHMVEIGDGASVAMSVSYNTDASRRRALLHVLRERLCEHHIELPPIGRHPLFDSVSHAGARALVDLHQLGRRMLGRSSISDGVPYALAE
ncbi:MAG: hypothetical protein GXC76_14850 [Rhodanobacteraceae bacterium]|jgi:hypothetical protein|nr:hypothetical protein [Rhodanobacteraceae bacterium]